jgi:hypothetical protein
MYKMGRWNKEQRNIANGVMLRGGEMLKLYLKKEGGGKSFVE